MATCVQENVSGVLEVVAPQPADASGCAMVLVSGAEYSANPYLLTASQGFEIGMYLMLASAIAWGVRKIADTFEDHQSNQES